MDWDADVKNLANPDKRTLLPNDHVDGLCEVCREAIQPEDVLVVLNWPDNHEEYMHGECYRERERE